MQIKPTHLKALCAAAPVAVGMILVAGLTASPGNAQVSRNAPMPEAPGPNIPNIPGPDIPSPDLDVPDFNVPNVDVPNVRQSTFPPRQRQRPQRQPAQRPRQRQRPQRQPAQRARQRQRPQRKRSRHRRLAGPRHPGPQRPERHCGHRSGLQPAENRCPESQRPERGWRWPWWRRWWWPGWRWWWPWSVGVSSLETAAPDPATSISHNGLTVSQEKSRPILLSFALSVIATDSGSSYQLI